MFNLALDVIRWPFYAASNVLTTAATNVFTAASDAAVVSTDLRVIQRSLEALTRSLMGAADIWRDIFTNRTNPATLAFILSHLDELFGFLYDLVRPGTVIAGRNNLYNELDLRQEDNRRGVIYQMQRVAKTVITFLNMGMGPNPPAGLESLQMNVSLRSDENMRSTYVSTPQGIQTSGSEKWLFINGIANEFVWFQRSCDKIRDTFHRDVTGIYNRTDGILWDLIECTGERSVAEEENYLIKRTQSSTAAQENLRQELKSALWPDNGPAAEKVVMIAHSQGALLLRLVLQELVEENPPGSTRRADMRDRLRVFTFGNPSIDWQVIDGLDELGQPLRQPLSSYAKTTEHFAHRADFVATLGIMMPRGDNDLSYDGGSIFVSTEGRGHLFGAHYPLEAAAYTGGQASTLLRAVGGQDID